MEVLIDCGNYFTTYVYIKSYKDKLGFQTE